MICCSKIYNSELLPFVMRKYLKWLLALTVGCVIIPQVIIYTHNEPKKPRFVVPHRKFYHNATIHELKEVNISRKNPLAFRPLKRSDTHDAEQLRKLPMKQKLYPLEKEEQETKERLKTYNKNVKDSDQLPLLYPDSDCGESYTGFREGSFCLAELNYEDYFTNNHIHHCFKEGTFSILKNGTECKCRNKWHGPYCSMHDVAHFSEYPRSKYAHMVSHQTRRVINAFPFSLEFALLEARLHELGDVVDLFVIVESNYTLGGHPRRRLLEQKFKNGYLIEFQHKIMYLSHGFFAKKAYHDVRLMEASLRNVIADGLKRISNLRLNDVLVLNDADEIPKRESLLFLKLHYGYPEPVGFYLIPNIYGFFWKSRTVAVPTFGACSIAMLFHLFHWELHRLKYALEQIGSDRVALDHFKYKHSGAVQPWSFGLQDLSQVSGWHCTWCLKPGEIKQKLEGAHWSFVSKWKAFPGLISEPRVKYNIANGIWIDGNTVLEGVNDVKSFWYAPSYLKNNSVTYNHLLIRPKP